MASKIEALATVEPQSSWVLRMTPRSHLSLQELRSGASQIGERGQHSVPWL